MFPKFSRPKNLSPSGNWSPRAFSSLDPAAPIAVNFSHTHPSSITVQYPRERTSPLSQLQLRWRNHRNRCRWRSIKAPKGFRMKGIRILGFLSLSLTLSFSIYFLFSSFLLINLIRCREDAIWPSYDLALAGNLTSIVHLPRDPKHKDIIEIYSLFRK